MNKQSYTIIEFYEAYDTEFPGVVTYQQYREIILDLFKSMSEGLLYKSEKYNLPCALGTLRIGKQQPKTYTKKSLAIDFKLTKEYGKTIYHTNEHSDGFKYRLYWSKVGLVNRRPFYYGVSLVRDKKRLLAQLIKNKQTDYPEI